MYLSEENISLRYLVNFSRVIIFFDIFPLIYLNCMQIKILPTNVLTLECNIVQQDIKPAFNVYL
jgi:hypothetical protein